MVTQGEFREDLFYRLNVIHILVPALRQRPEDVTVLVDHFLTAFSRHNGDMARAISPEALKVLTGYSWPGNVRELANVVERLVVTTRHEVVMPDDLPLEIRSHGSKCGGSPRPERRRTMADVLYARLTDEDRSRFPRTINAHEPSKQGGCLLKGPSKSGSNAASAGRSQLRRRLKGLGTSMTKL